VLPGIIRIYEASDYDEVFSELLKNEAGLYRVSVMATDDIISARNEIGRIRSKFPSYSDTWLLIRK